MEKVNVIYNTMYNDVCEFNETIIKTKMPGKPIQMTIDRAKFATTVLMEEVFEFIEAWKNEDIPGQFDAMLDIIYYAMGRCYEMGISPEEFKRGWDLVHEANMQKRPGNKGRGSDQDAVKPEGWTAPKLEVRQ